MHAGHVQLGQSVISQDGEKLGSVDRLLVSDEEQRVDGIIVHKLLGAADRIVEMTFIDHVDDDGVHLSITKDQVEELPTYVEEEYVALSPDAALHDTYASTYAGAGGVGNVFVTAPAGGVRTVQDVTSRSFFDPAIPPGSVAQDVSNVPAGEVMIESGTDVVGSDGDKVGSVDEVLFDAEGRITGFIVRAGFLFKHDVMIPIERVAEIGHDQIHLNVTGDQAEAEGRRD